MKLANAKKFLATALLLGLSSTALVTHAANEYEWNANAPVKVPGANANGKTVLFDVSHGGTEGNADWVIDGGFSDFADALTTEGYRVEEYRGIDLNNDGLIRFYDDLNTPSNSSINEAIITYDAIKHADVFVLAETNRPFKISEYQALEQFVAAGKGIFFVADHYNADRNLNTWDATEVFNGYNRSILNTYNYGGEYGDLRNPGNTQGWLANNFGIRFRFNSVDYLAGVSDITAPVNAEGITQGVDPILMAAGATLAITDASKAKGLVYFAAGDNPTPWKHANDAGLYYGGRDEGPYVAIAKSGLGKAAFIGDSSPIEDATPKYRRQDSGSVKKTYPGWTDPGHASVLSVNIINWLATPESYTHFDNINGHVSGELTPNPKAPTEMDDPDNGNPWSNPSGGYNPWDPSTFANGSFAAKWDVNGGGNGGGTGSEISVSDALATSTGTAIQVKGVVTASVNGIYGLQLNDETDNSVYIYVKLESQFRNDFNPDLNPAIVGETILVTGTRDTYMSQPGVRNVSAIEIVNPTPTALTVTQALAESNGTLVVVEGIVQAELNGIYALLLADGDNPNTTINVKLESAQRNEFNPQLNPSILNNRIRVTGTRNDYMSAPGIRFVTEIVDLGEDNSNGGGTGNTLSVSNALQEANGTSLVVEGEITSALNGIYALVLTDDNDANTTINVKLESDQRSQFSPDLNPSILNHRICVTGTKNDYMSQPGIRDVTEIVDLGIPSNTNYTSVSDALSSATGTALDVEGFVIQEVNGIYGLLLQDVNDASKTINVKLESQHRNDFNPQLNPSIVGAQILVTGQRDAYMGQPGLRYVTDLQILAP